MNCRTKSARIRGYGRFHGSETQTRAAPGRAGNRRASKILDATLRVIAREGVRGTTHRSIAGEAGVQLSLTTYYFKDLNELLSLAFRSFMDRDYGDGLTEQWNRAFRYLDQFSAYDLARGADTRDNAS